MMVLFIRREFDRYSLSTYPPYEKSSAGQDEEFNSISLVIRMSIQFIISTPHTQERLNKEGGEKYFGAFRALIMYMAM